MSQLLQNAAAGTVLILVTAALRLVLKKRLPPEVWLALWAICLFRLLTPAVPESALSLYGLPRLLTSEAPPVQTVPLPVQPNWSAPPGEVFGPVSPAPPVSPVSPTAPAWNWETVLMALWLLGAAATALRFALSWRRTRRAVGCAALLPPSDPRYAALPPGVRLREGPVEGAPLTFGVVRPTVVLPPDLFGRALDCVLAHEGVHARRRDNLWHYAVASARIVFWWNPAVVLMDRLLRRDLELSCDRAALRRLGEDRRRDYAETLLSLSTPADGPVFSQSFGQKQALERIIAVMKCKKMSVCSIIMAIVLLCGVTSAFATNPITKDEPAQAKPDPTENVHYELSIPTQEEVKQNGYPINENGETYGPHIGDNAYVNMNPDLLLAESQEDGTLGYVRLSEYPLDSKVNNPEEAMVYMAHQADWENHTERDHYANLYLQDGVTVIGRFIVDAYCGCDVMQSRNK